MERYEPDRVWHANASIQFPVFRLFERMDDQCRDQHPREIPFTPFMYDRTNSLVNTLKQDLWPETTHDA